MTNSSTPERRLVLLDVDGVINDLRALEGRERPYRVDQVSVGGFDVFIPDYMPALIQGICAVSEVIWCTTWEHDANLHIAPILGIDPLPVVELEWETGWKAGAARPVLLEAHEAGRTSFWIEDFEGVPSDLPPSTVPIDTTSEGVLLPEAVPDVLRPRSI